MDTRQKIVTREGLPGLLAEGTWCAVAGLFDPLTLIQAERLATAARDGHKLLAVVSPDSDTLLTADARAALVAGLRVVDAVVIAEADEVRAFGVVVDDDPEAERKRSADFVHFVFERAHG